MNQNYDQVVDMFLQGNLSWQRDAVIAMLYTSLVFDSSDKTVADLAGSRLGVQKIDGRLVQDGMAYGLPVAFQKVAEGMNFQVVVAQDVGNNNPNLLAYIDVNTDDSPINVQNSGTLIIRPVLPVIPILNAPPTIGVWMRLSA